MAFALMYSIEICLFICLIIQMLFLVSMKNGIIKDARESRYLLRYKVCELLQRIESSLGLIDETLGYVFKENRQCNAKISDLSDILLSLESFQEELMATKKISKDKNL